MPVIDLHAHTKYSDGTTAPAEVVSAYIRAGVQMMAITDHDTTAAVEEARKKASAAGLLFVDGIEISTREHDYLHILGYRIDIKNKTLNKFLEDNRAARFERVRGIIKKLQAAGVNISEEEVFALVKTTPSRAHVADALKKKGIVSSRHEGFCKYLTEGRAGYVPSPGPVAAEVISQIKQAGGYAFIAHPGVIQEAWDFPRWTTNGLDGLELYYPSHSFEMRQELSAIAKKYGLLVSAGSDHHGEKSGRRNTPGMQAPQEVFDKLKEVLCKS
ncbi:MAG: PHP domain-containing protein [Elusimicrobiota bacterium]|jgi:predicted metal-dependent phosphoesterase TrpH|nr:PHP domain-containing protein [Elusimicrobiota bacterium]